MPELHPESSSDRRAVYTCTFQHVNLSCKTQNGNSTTTFSERNEPWISSDAVRRQISAQLDQVKKEREREETMRAKIFMCLQTGADKTCSEAPLRDNPRVYLYPLTQTHTHTRRDI